MRHCYANLNKKNFFATSVCLVVLCGLIAALIFAFIPASERRVPLVLGCAFIVPMALYCWIGNGALELGCDSWADWLVAFFGGALISILFIVIDCGLRTPFVKGIVLNQSDFIGLSTLVVMAITLVALCGALRAWLLGR